MKKKKITMLPEIIEEKLVSDLNLLRATSQRFCCFYMKNASLVDKEWFTKNVNEVLSLDKISFYFCIKGIFVITPDTSVEDFKKIRSIIANKIKQDEIEVSELFKRYDPQDDWHTIITLAGDELKNKKQYIKDNKHKELLEFRKKRNEEIINGIVNEEALPNFNQMRGARDQKTVLIVEDEDFSAILLKSLVGKGYRTVVAKTGYDAIDQYMIEAPNLVLLDIELPDMSGLDVLSKLKTVDEEANVVVVTAHGTTENISQAIKNKAVGFVSKPVSRQKIMQYLD